MAISSLRRTILLSLEEIVPASALRVLAVPPAPPDVIETLVKRPGAQITIAAPDSAEAGAAAPFDCIFCEPRLAGGCAPACEMVLDGDGLGTSHFALRTSQWEVLAGRRRAATDMIVGGGAMLWK